MANWPVELEKFAAENSCTLVIIPYLAAYTYSICTISTVIQVSNTNLIYTRHMYLFVGLFGYWV